MNLVFLDACRDNPLTRSFARALPATRAVSVGSGLTAVDAGRGTLIAFATAPNKVAFDGKGRNSPFTAALLKHIRTPGLDIAFVMRRVTADVETASGGTQVPWVHASLTTDVMLKRGEGTTTLPLPPAGTPGPSADEITWSMLKDTKDIEQLRRFLQQFPASAQKTEVENRIASLGQAGSSQFTTPPALRAEPPQKALPKELSIAPEILRKIESDPLFANGPPISVRTYSYDQLSGSTVNGVRVTTNYNNESSVEWLRPGLVQEDTTMQWSSVMRSMTVTSTSHTKSFGAANGLVSLGYQSSFRTKNPLTKTMSGTSGIKLVNISNMRGVIFPLQIGNRFSYEATYQTTSSYERSDEQTTEYSCEFTKKFEAKRFHTKLGGSAYLLTCDERTVYKRNKSLNRNSQSKTIFFDDLGISVRVDPTFPKEQIIQTFFENNATETAALKSFDLVR